MAPTAPTAPMAAMGLKVPLERLGLKDLKATKVTPELQDQPV